MSSRRGGNSGVRILAGRWKGRRLDAPPASRPTSARAREALFDLLGNRIEGSRVLDLYAGSGAVGLEAVSRGASRAVLVESEAAALRRTVARVGASGEEVRVIERGAAAAIDDLIREGEGFDIVFADPPYDLSPKDAGVGRVARLMTPEGIFVFQRDGTTEAPPEVAGLRLLRHREYGRNVFYFFGML